ncbi:MAG: hypothetical protein H0W61_07075 [Bacteroidetes bacterium]|nr:hypothetical protein [Bacteroidota bacterium]
MNNQKSTPIEALVIEKQFSLNKKDLLKAILMAILTPVLVLIQNSLDAGHFDFHWKPLTMAAIGGLVAYLLKNYFAPTRTVIKGEFIDEN